MLYHIEKEHTSKTKNNVKNTEGQDESQIYWELCSIKCKNKKALEKLMNSNHEGHKSCEVCGEKKLLSAETLKNHVKNIHNNGRSYWYCLFLIRISRPGGISIQLVNHLWYIYKYMIYLIKLWSIYLQLGVAVL